MPPGIQEVNMIPYENHVEPPFLEPPLVQSEFHPAQTFAQDRHRPSSDQCGNFGPADWTVTSSVAAQLPFVP